MPPRAFKRLVELKEETEANSYVEVIRNALMLYSEIVEQAMAGNELMLRRPNGAISPYPLLIAGATPRDKQDEEQTTGALPAAI